MAEWHLTPHTSHRIEQMGVTEAQVIEVIEDAEVSYPSKGDLVFQRGQIAVVVAGDDGRVTTVLWRTEEVYQR